MIGCAYKDNLKYCSLLPWKWFGVDTMLKKWQRRKPLLWKISLNVNSRWTKLMDDSKVVTTNACQWSIHGIWLGLPRRTPSVSQCPKKQLVRGRSSFFHERQGRQLQFIPKVNQSPCNLNPPQASPCHQCLRGQCPRTSRLFNFT